MERAPASQHTDYPPQSEESVLGAALAARVQRLRKAQRLSLDALALRSGLSKGTVVAIEQGKANPSIGVLCRLAVGLSRSVTDLLASGSDDRIPAPIERTSPVTLWKTERGSEAVLLASTTGPTMFEVWSWTLAPGDVHHADAHSLGTRELVAVERGELHLRVGDEALTLRAGETARLRTDQPHSYAAATDVPVTFTMAVLEHGDSRPLRDPV